MTLQELHVALGIPVGSMHRLLATLAAEEFVTRSPVSRKYFLGQAARALDPGPGAESSLMSAPPAVSAAAAASGETVFVTELIDGVAVCICLVEARHPLRLFVRIGQEMPLNAAASARVILAYQEQELAAELIAHAPMRSFTADTPMTAEAVLSHLGRIKVQGFDVCDSELDPNVWAVAAPIFDSRGRVTSSVTLAAAAARMADPLVRTSATEAVLLAARALSEEQGYLLGGVPSTR
jgi:IclR family acetate operon transcriptional repressor